MSPSSLPVNAKVLGLCALTLGYGEQVAEVVGVRLGGWRLEALHLTQHKVIIGGQV